jgi:hypothetical protein
MTLLFFFSLPSLQNVDHAYHGSALSVSASQPASRPAATLVGCYYGTQHDFFPARQERSATADFAVSSFLASNHDEVHHAPSDRIRVAYRGTASLGGSRHGLQFAKLHMSSHLHGYGHPNYSCLELQQQPAETDRLDQSGSGPIGIAFS